MNEMKNPKPFEDRFAICIDNEEYPVSLETHKIYRVIPDEAAKADGDMRVIDESGEDYLYPANCFILVEIPGPAAKSIHKSFTRRAFNAA